MPRKMQPIDGAELRSLVQAGKTLAAIGAHSGVSVNTVYRWTRLYGLRTVSNKGRPRTDPAPLVRRSGRNKAPKPVIQRVSNVRPSAGSANNPFGI